MTTAHCRAHLHCGEGVSGDMLVGACVDAGVPSGVIQEAIDVLELGAELSFPVRRVRGLMATGFEVDTSRSRRLPHWSDLRSAIDGAGFSVELTHRAHLVLEALVRAEATVHGTTVAETHLHELGDADTIVDVVAVCRALEFLEVAELHCSPVALGGGHVHSEHGRLPVPAPAVTELLRGWQVEVGGVSRELTTPTGAAIVSTLGKQVVEGSSLVLQAAGHGVGSRGPQPSMVTLHVGREVSREARAHRRVLLETTIDDITPELVPRVLDRLRAEGAEDAWAVPCSMKKGRMGTTLTALAPPESLAVLRELLFREAGTLGLRWWEVKKEALTRRWMTVRVDGCEVRVKIAERDDVVISRAPEYEDVVSAAECLGRPAREVYFESQRLAHDVVDG